MGLTWSGVSGARRRSSGLGRRSDRRGSSGRGVATMNFMEVLTLRVVAKTRSRAEFETTFHSGRLSFGNSGILCGVVKEEARSRTERQ